MSHQRATCATAVKLVKRKRIRYNQRNIKSHCSLHKYKEQSCRLVADVLKILILNLESAQCTIRVSKKHRESFLYKHEQFSNINPLYWIHY